MRSEDDVGANLSRSECMPVHRQLANSKKASICLPDDVAATCMHV